MDKIIIRVDKHECLLWNRATDRGFHYISCPFRISACTTLCPLFNCMDGKHVTFSCGCCLSQYEVESITRIEYDEDITAEERHK